MTNDQGVTKVVYGKAMNLTIGLDEVCIAPAWIREAYDFHLVIIERRDQSLDLMRRYAS